MKTLDLRSWTTKLAHTLWQGEKHTATPIKPWGWGSFISRITRMRIAKRPSSPPNPFIVSVGNLALGGTGKTPVVSALAQDLSAQGLKGAILTRGYRSPLAGPVIVTMEMLHAGDEARQLAHELAPSGWIVVQARNRLEGLRWLQQQGQHIDIVIAEDAHQTANLPRHLDIIILDKWQLSQKNKRQTVVATTGSVFPFGPYRENAQGALRANIWLLEAESTACFEAESLPEITVTTFARQTVLPPAAELMMPYGVLSGIARPWRFEKAMCSYMGQDPALVVRCNDHDAYSGSMINKIVLAARETGLKTVITTAKDWVKLQTLWPDSLPVQVAKLEISWGKSKTLPDLVRERFNAFQSN